VPTIALADVEEGAVLASAVYSARGLLLAPAGTVITAAHLATFASWGVVEADIVADSSAAAGPRQLDEAQLDEVRQQVEERFSLNTTPNPLMREVRRVTEQILIRRLLK
jgi:hypothetical protein